MTDADELIVQQRFAFRMAPQIVEGDKGWRAQYPGADWSVVGSTPRDDLVDRVTAAAPLDGVRNPGFRQL